MGPKAKNSHWRGRVLLTLWFSLDVLLTCRKNTIHTNTYLKEANSEVLTHSFAKNQSLKLGKHKYLQLF